MHRHYLEKAAEVNNSILPSQGVLLNAVLLLLQGKLKLGKTTKSYTCR